MPEIRLVRRPLSAPSCLAGAFGRRPALLVVLPLLLALAPDARAEVVQLIDNTRVAGRLVHYYDGVLVLETAQGRVSLPREKVKSVTFEVPAPRPELSTPEKTFERWRKAMLAGDMATVIDCYALMVQGLVANQMGEVKPEDLQRAQKEVQGTRFSLRGSQIQGEKAVLKVQRQRGDDVDTAELNFARENGEWKLLP